LRDYRATGDRRPRNDAVEAMIPLVDLLARRLRRRDASYEDLRQVALLAVVRAADRFDPDRGVHFATFVSRTVEGELKRYHRDRTWIVRPTRSSQELFLLVRRAEEELAQRFGRSPSVIEVAEELDESVDHVLEAMQVSTIRMPATVEADHGANGPDDAPGPLGVVAAQIDEGYESIDNEVLLSQLLEKISPRDRKLLEMRFVQNRSQQEIANELGVTQSYLSRLLRQTLENVATRLRLESSGA